MRRRPAVPAAVLAAGLVLAGCGGNSTTGGMPTPAGDDGSSTSSTPSPTLSVGTPTTAPTDPASTPPAKAAQVIVAPGAFGDNPAVRGLIVKYPLYFRALVQRDTELVKANFPAYFYADTANSINDAKAGGWVMKPPGSVVVVGVEQQPYGIVRIRFCRSQRTQYWNPKAKTWVRVAPKGSPEVIDMVERGDGWTMYRAVQPVPKPFSCARVRYPA